MAPGPSWFGGHCVTCLEEERENMKQATIVLLASILIYDSVPSSAQQPDTPPPCNQPEARQLDFWVGEWDLEWGDGGKGTNVIEATLDGCVIVEDFDGTSAISLREMSVSTYNAQLGKWQQTWVDNQGSYLDFVGDFEDSKMVLQSSATVGDKEVLQRMVYYDIRKDSLMWNWERSEDGGKTWQVL